jgi:hypothetical protein
MMKISEIGIPATLCMYILGMLKQRKAITEMDNNVVSLFLAFLVRQSSNTE